MSRRWVVVLATLSGWAAAASCSLDIGPVLKASKDGGGSGGSGGKPNPDSATDTGSQDAPPDGIYELPPGCLNAAVVEADCDPRTNAGCYGGLGCDTTFYTKPRLACLPNDGVQLGGACNNATGPYCAPKLTCTGAPGVCTNFCCTPAECSGGPCIPFDPNLGSLGFCSNVDGGTTADAGACSGYSSVGKVCSSGSTCEILITTAGTSCNDACSSTGGNCAQAYKSSSISDCQQNGQVSCGQDASTSNPLVCICNP